MKLKDYARQQGISYRTAWRWWKAGKLSAVWSSDGHGHHPLETEPPGASRVSQRAAIYAPGVVR